jgi:hypothetical protein
MKSAQALFAELTMALEDMHALAVDGQSPDFSPAARELLADSIRSGLNDAYLIVMRIVIADL